MEQFSSQPTKSTNHSQINSESELERIWSNCFEGQTLFPVGGVAESDVKLGGAPGEQGINEANVNMIRYI